MFKKEFNLKKKVVEENFYNIEDIAANYPIYEDLLDAAGDLDNFIIIDSEGACCNGGPGLSTYYVGLISWIHVVGGYIVKIDNTHISLPVPLPPDHFIQWQVCRKGMLGKFEGHGLIAQQKGIDLGTWQRGFCRYLEEQNFPLILAKGKALEERLLNNIGLQGQVADVKYCRSRGLFKIPIIDLNDYVRRYSDAFPGRTHEPVKECVFFFKELLNNNLLPRERTLDQG